MIRKVIALAGGAAVVAGLGLAGAGAAMASPRAVPDNVNATVVFTGPSDAGGLSSTQAEQPCGVTLTECTDTMAGWYVSNFAQTFSQVDATFTLDAEAAGIGVSCISPLSPVSCWASPISNPKKVGWTGTTPPTTEPTQDVINGAIGDQLCMTTGFGQAAQIGAADLGPIGFGGEQEFALGYITGDLHGLATDPCVGGGVVASNPNQFNLLGAFPVGSAVQTQIRQEFSHNHPTGLLFSGQLVNGVTDYSYFMGCGHHLSTLRTDVTTPSFFDPCAFYPNEAGAGLQANSTGLSAPASNDLTDFTNVTAESQGQTHGFAAWNAVQVEGSQDGIAPALLAPTSLNSSACTRTFHPGHRYYYGAKGHRHYRWIKGYWTSAGCGASSFSVDAGTPVS